jgi:hypothetical protein
MSWIRLGCDHDAVCDGITDRSEVARARRSLAHRPMVAGGMICLRFVLAGQRRSPRRPRPRWSRSDGVPGNHQLPTTSIGRTVESDALLDRGPGAVATGWPGDARQLEFGP